jgi:CO/xanthine dehydrogenase FAD-binding subunit
MKPAPFDYVAPTDLTEALGLIDDDSRPLAGGQSLVPLLNFRLARPARLVDLNGIEALSGLRRDERGWLRIGALTRQSQIERAGDVASGWPLLVQAVRHVGHPPIRSRGTVGGSVSHADPTAELPTALLTLGATFHVASATGERTVVAEEFFIGPLMTILEVDELLVEIRVPPAPAGTRSAFVEYARVHGDFAVAGVAALFTPGETRFGVLGAGGRPRLAHSVAEAAALADDPWKRELITSLAVRASDQAK